MVQSCQNCHPDDLASYYGKYASILGVSTTPEIKTQSAFESLSNALCITPASVNPNGNPVSPTSHNLLFIIILVVIILASAGLMFFIEKQRKGKKQKKEEK